MTTPQCLDYAAGEFAADKREGTARVAAQRRAPCVRLPTLRLETVRNSGRPPVRPPGTVVYLPGYDLHGLK